MDSSPALKFDPNDFQSIQWSFEITNLTSRQPVQPSGAIQLIEMADHGLTVSFPSRSCAVGHQLQFKALVSLPSHGDQPTSGSIELLGTARVESVEKHGTSDLVEITFQQIDEAAWAKVHGALADRQTAILDFFRSVKGED